MLIYSGMQCSLWIGALRGTRLYLYKAAIIPLLCDERGLYSPEVDGPGREWGLARVSIVHRADWAFPVEMIFGQFLKYLNF